MDIVKTLLFLLAIVGLLAVPMIASAETGQRCAPVPQNESRSDSETPMLCADASHAAAPAGQMLLASTTILDCRANQRTIGRCPESQPYFHVFSSTCHATLMECKKQDGDAANVPGSGGCVLCGRYR